MRGEGAVSNEGVRSRLAIGARVRVRVRVLMQVQVMVMVKVRVRVRGKGAMSNEGVRSRLAIGAKPQGRQTAALGAKSCCCTHAYADAAAYMSAPEEGARTFGMVRTSGVISRACRRRSSCSWRASDCGDSWPLLLLAAAACNAAIGLLPAAVPAATAAPFALALAAS